jgi:hypothetical protein
MQAAEVKNYGQNKQKYIETKNSELLKQFIY